MKSSYIKKLQSKRIWDLDFVAEMTGSVSSAKGLMRAYTNNHAVSSVRRDLYVANDLASEHPIANKFEIASAITGDSYVAYHSAMEYHGLGHQISFEVQAGSSKRFRNFTFDGLNYICCHQTISDGVYSPSFDSKVRVTDLERTIVDCADKLDLAGGWEELFNCLSACPRVNVLKIFNYANLFGKMVLYRKLGLLCEIFSDSWKVTADQKELFLRAGGDTVMSFTDRQDSDTFINSWRIYVPKGILVYIKGEQENEII